MYNFDEMYKRFVNCNYKQCADCEYFIGNGYHAVSKMAGKAAELIYKEEKDSPSDEVCTSTSCEDHNQ